MELANARKKLKSLKLSNKNKKMNESVKRQEFEEKMLEKLKVEKPSTISETGKMSRSLSAESKTRIKENLSRNRSFKTILNTSSFDPTAPTLFNNVNTFEVCNKLGRSFSFQSNYVFGRNEDSPSQLAALDTASFSPSPTVISEKSEVSEEKCSTSMQDLLLKEFFSPDRDFSGSKCALNELACTSGNEINEYFILPKFLLRKNSTVIDPKPESAVKLSDVQESIEQPPSESLIEFCDEATSSSTSLVSKINEYSYFPALAPASNRFYHSDLDLNQITERFKNKLSFSHQEINLNDDSEWSINENSRVNPSDVDDCEEKSLSRNLEEIKYNKFLNDLLNTEPRDEGLLFDLKSTQSSESKTVGYKAKSYSSNQLEVDKPPIKTHCQSHQKKLPPLFNKNSTTEKRFGSNPVLRSNLCTNENISLANSTTTVHIPQLSSRLEDIPLINRRGYINLNDACLSNSDDINRAELSSDQKVQASDDDLPNNNRFNGRQSRFEYCRNNVFPNASKAASLLNPTLSRKHSLNLDCQSEENIFNINIDSFYDDFVDSAEWSSSSSSESLESSCTSSLGLDKKYLLLPEIKLDQTELKTGATSLVDTKTLENNNIPPTEENPNTDSEQLELSGKLRCSKCKKKLGIVMVFKCHCEKYFCSTHRYSSMHDCNFDYKTHARELLRRENPLCVTEKLPKI